MPFWGIVLVVVGLIILGNQLNWFDLEVPFIPVALIVLGCYLIISRK
ncbi:MAG: DUF5668 domain-containing protein [bacterium]